MKTETNSAEELLEAIITELLACDLRFPDDLQQRVFGQYVEILRYSSQLECCENVLEIGAGFSTVVLSYLKTLKDCRVISIDMNPDNLISKLESSPRQQQQVESSVEFIKGTTCTSSALRKLYENFVLENIGEIDAASVISGLQTFVENGLDSRREGKVAETLGLSTYSLQELTQSILKDNAIRLPRTLVDSYRNPNDEIDYLEQGLDGEYVGDELIAEGRKYDLVFFDGGEFATLLDWELLSSSIRKGGLAAFHDVYFPKSMKSWLVCAAITADPSWSVLYRDKTTPQGLLIARKL
jgi:predicted O-methyltransferase YrrM